MYFAYFAGFFCFVLFSVFTCAFLFCFLKEGASVQRYGELAGPVLEQQNGMEQSCQELQDVVPF